MRRPAIARAASPKRCTSPSLASSSVRGSPLRMSAQPSATLFAILPWQESSRKQSISSAAAYRSSFLTSFDVLSVESTRTSRIDPTPRRRIGSGGAGASPVLSAAGPAACPSAGTRGPAASAGVAIDAAAAGASAEFDLQPQRCLRDAPGPDPPWLAGGGPAPAPAATGSFAAGSCWSAVCERECRTNAMSNSRPGSCSLVSASARKSASSRAVHMKRDPRYACMMLCGKRIPSPCASTSPSWSPQVTASRISRRRRGSFLCRKPWISLSIFLYFGCCLASGLLAVSSVA